MSQDYSYHRPVLFDECMDGLNIRPDSIILDCTLGGGGHSAGILERLGSAGCLIAIDRDPHALEVAGEKLAGIQTEAQCLLRRSTFADFDQCLQQDGIQGLDGVLADLGVSSAQLDRVERGFSYMQDAALDMRMDPDSPVTAESILRDYSEAELTDIFFRYGEERYSRRIAGAIVARRQSKPLESSQELVNLIISAIPAAARREKQHPAKRCFQALRIAVNGELDQLEAFLQKIPQAMNPGGRICLISFHSLEDRLIKNAMKDWENPCHCPSDIPYCICGKQSLGKRVERQGIIAGSEEAEQNSRSRSARLRIFEMKRTEMLEQETGRKRGKK